MLMKADPATRLAPARPFALSLGLRARWRLFRLLETLSALRNRGSKAGSPQRMNPAPPFGAGQPSIWVFVSTIGELNAIEPFLRPFLQEMAPAPVTLLTDRRVYRESYLAKYPDAYVYEIDGTSSDIERLLSLTPPRLLLIAEIPCLLSDAPCRLPFATIYGAKRAGARVVLVNGWLYGYAPPSRLDAIERKLLGRDYLRLMDLITVQTDEVREQLIAEGADPARLHVTGNTKFDAVTQHEWSPAGKRSEAILRGILEGGRGCITAGCVTDYADQLMILDAFAFLTEQLSDAVLVLVPRHPENKEMISKLEVELGRRGLRHCFRSRLQDCRLGPDLQVLVVDTLGELKDFYAVSDVSYVGRDHNILEPLTFGKPVTISPGWNATYPSYPVYAALRTSEGILEADSAFALGAYWQQVLSRQPKAFDRNEAICGTLQRLCGASEANLRIVMPLMPH